MRLRSAGHRDFFTRTVMRSHWITPDRDGGPFRAPVRPGPVSPPNRTTHGKCGNCPAEQISTLARLSIWSLNFWMLKTNGIESPRETTALYLASPTVISHGARP